jgi:hypothetical protein
MPHTDGYDCNSSDIRDSVHNVSAYHAFAGAIALNPSIHELFSIQLMRFPLRLCAIQASGFRGYAMFCPIGICFRFFQATGLLFAGSPQIHDISH